MLTKAIAGKLSPDAKWNEISFIIKRILRRPTTPLNHYKNKTLNSTHLNEIKAAALRSRSKSSVSTAFIFGVMPRSGTNYLEKLLLTHPKVNIPNNGLRELPILAAAEEIKNFESALSRFYSPNKEVFKKYEWLAYAASGFINNIVKEVENSDTSILLLKDPHMRNIDLFEAIFPLEKSLLVLRDGRYVIDSTLRTWPLRRFGRTFEDICLEWAAATNAALAYSDRTDPNSTKIVRYEALAKRPVETIKEVSKWLNIETSELQKDNLINTPVLGSSIHSKNEQGDVDWKPLAKSEDFNLERELEWPKRYIKIFDNICGETQERAGYR